MSELPSWYEVDKLIGTAEFCIASPRVVVGAVATNVSEAVANVEAEATDGVSAVADVVARPASWHDVNLLVGTAAYFIAAPRAGNSVVFTAIIVAGATNSADTFANVVAIVAYDMAVDANVGDAVFTAVVESSATDGVETVANVVARPATLVVVVGVVVESPGLAPLAIPPDAVAWSPVVQYVADGRNSVVNPVVFNPAGLFPPS